MEEAEEKAKQAAADLERAKKQQQKWEEQQRLQALAELNAKKAKEAADAADKEKDAVTAQSSQAWNDAVLNKVAADQALAASQAENKRVQEERNSERTDCKNFLDKYSSFVSTYNMNWETYLAGVNTTGSGKDSVDLVLVDPPYEINFVKKSQRSALGSLLDTVTKRPSTAVVFMSWHQIEGWKHIFERHTEGNGWVIEGVQAIHRHPLHAGRGSHQGHKSMTEFVMIAHRKDDMSDDRAAQNGRRLPFKRELEELFGDPPSGNYIFDFMTECLPPERKW